MQPLTRLIIALTLATLFGGCASTGGVPRPFPVPGGRPGSPLDGSTPAAPRPSPTGGPIDTDAIVSTALGLRGVPYRNGGSGPDGFDCSGFTQYVFGQHGLALHRETRDQFGMGERVDLSDIEPGDLLFFSTVARGPSHVAIAVGGDEFVHAPSSRGLVRVERLSVEYWSERFVGARRLTN